MDEYLKGLIGKDLYNEIISIISLDKLSEIRLRLDKEVALKDVKDRFFLKRITTQKMINDVVYRATNHSLYAYQEEIASGFIHCDFGIRIGLAGRGVFSDEKIISFKDFSSINIRIPHEIIGCSDQIQALLSDFKNTIIIAPPFAGKTTLIRDMARVLSNRYDVTIIDEREEITNRNSHFSFGPLCDSVLGIPKALVFEGIIRALSPEIIILDEIFPKRDEVVVEGIHNAGIRIIASLHGDSIEKFIQSYKKLASVFNYGVLLSNKPHAGSIQSIVRFNFGD
ncbi:MAG: hypothetical protein LBU04_02295 [Christensenellaceae bacterium]|nr:hypothetical protein [Christensenellaceae bacterium]